MAILGETVNRRGLGWLIFAAWLMVGGVVATAQSAPSKEYQVKAVFLFHFAQFVEWPSNAFSESGSPFVIGVLGDDPFGSFLDETVRGERVDGHPLVIRRFKRIEDVGGCHVLFITRSESGRLDQVLSGLKGRSILTVSDVADFSRRGGMIRFVIEDSKTRLHINVEAAKAAHLTISSKLLRPAQIVTGGGR